MPALIGNAHPGLIKGHGHQLLLIVAVPRREQGMAEHRGTGAPGLASVEQPHVPGGVTLTRACGARPPTSPRTAGCWRAAQLFDDRLCVGVALIEFTQPQIMSADLGQALKAFQRVPAAR